MVKNSKMASLACILLLEAFCLVVTGGVARSQEEKKPAPSPNVPAEQFYKNIKVLTGVPSDQIVPTMQFIAASLGVECNFCHVKDAFDKDDKENKQTARKMIQMQMAINKDNFEGHTDVTCFSCHRGSHEPVAIPLVVEEESRPEAAETKPAEANPAPRPTADALLLKYVQALGGADSIAKISSRQEKGNILFGDQQFPVEIFTKAPDKRISVMHTPRGESITAFDGKSGWLGGGPRPPQPMSAAETETYRLDSDFYFATDLKNIFPQLRAGRPEKIGHAEANLVFGIRPGQPPVKFYFDTASGLLIRQVRYAQTALGRLPTQIDYSDYREVDGVKIPFRWTLARANGRFTIQIDEAKDNVAIDDAKFAMPAPAAN
ncbi:MAG: c-type cytochrome [Candidatus Acidiferrales bacterium]